MARVFIAEDTKTNRYILEKMLRANGYDVHAFINGRELLDQFMLKPADIVITDIQMPVMDGYELVNNIRANRKYDHIPIILISATFRDIQSRIKGLDSGANDYLVAPIDTDELLAKVKAMLKVKDLYENLQKAQTELKKTNTALKKEMTGRKIVESELRESEERFRAIVENAPFGYYRVGKDGSWQYVNPVWEHMHGLLLKDVIEKPFEITQPEDSVEQARELVKRALAGETIFGESSRLKRDGNVEYHSFNIQPVKYGKKIVAIEGFINDITERKQAEEALLESEEKYRQLYESNQMPISIFDIETLKFLSVNNAFAEKYGYTKEEFLKMTILDIRPESETVKLKDSVKITDSGLTNAGVFLHKKKNGGIIHVEIIRYDLVFEGKNAKLVFANDITERKQAEEKVNHLAAIVQSSADAIIGRSLDGIITSWNKGAEKLYGFTESEVIGKSISLLIPPGNDEDISTILDMIKSGEYIDKYETVRRRKDGREIQVSLAVSPILNSEGKIIAASTIGRDITKQKEILAAMQASAGQSNGLKNLIPICAGCNKIRDDDQESHPWVSPAVYINDRLPNVNFSHGMCPDCMVKWYPDFSEEKQKK